MPQVSLDVQPSRQSSGNSEGPNVGRPVQPNSRPRVVLLESGVKALVEVVGLADVDAVVEAVLVSTEVVDTGDGIEG